MSAKRRVLFLCIHNSARSQIAEAFFNARCGDALEAESAGVEPGALNPLAVEVMREVGIDLSGKRTQSVFEVEQRGARFAYVVTVCEEAAERCPVFSGAAARLAWHFPDPSRFEGTREQKLQQTRQVRDAIRREVEAWCDTIGAGTRAS